MGNVPPAQFSIPAMGVSTRSSPIEGYVVAEERGIVFGTSEKFHNQNAQTAVPMLQQAISMIQAECTRLGGNTVLGMHAEIKDIANQGHMYQCYGTACIVRPRQ